MLAEIRAKKILLIACFLLGLPAKADFALPETKLVPIARLLKNLAAQKNEIGLSPTDKAMIEFRIGRLHSMAYALKSEQGQTEKSAIAGSRYELPQFGSQPDHVQFQVQPAKNKGQATLASGHLEQAIVALKKSLVFDPSLLPAKLSLAWCFEHSGKKDEARSLYKEVFREAYAGEKTSRGGVLNWSIAVETAGYLKPLLDSRKDAKEIVDITGKVNELQKLPRFITPILIPLARENSLKRLIERRAVRFDLDGLGVRSYDCWPAKNAGWLVFDSQGKGQIDSGLQLIGGVTFWLFWQNGYEVLASLDDNGDGKISGCELACLSIWQDLNGNGVSEPGEVKSLADWHIAGLAVSGHKNKHGVLCNPDGVILTNGLKKPTFDLILHEIK
ncbi:MAG: tetratricopeptide repeat protein [Candidatus Obscuribacterales bacterium]|nr:tetratricopeptide repeat protein [Candidatus Obscuribacterales bacterium]